VRVTIVRGGGLAGIVTRTEIDSKSLSPQDAHTLVQEVDRAGVRHLDEPPSRQNRPDDLLYEILLDDGDAVSTRFTDESMPAGVRRLVEWIDARPERSYAVEP
jgi:hypothetical protein